MHLSKRRFLRGVQVGCEQPGFRRISGSQNCILKRRLAKRGGVSLFGGCHEDWLRASFDVGPKPQLQEKALNSAGCETLFTEYASGAQCDRPELAAALSYARSGDLLVVWKLDRLARYLSQLLATSELLEQRGVGSVSITEQINTSTLGGRLVFQLFGALAEFERSLLRERTLAGLAAAGRKGGRPPALLAEKKRAAKAMPPQRR